MSAGRREEAQRGRNKGPRPGSKADQWRRSPMFRAIAIQALADFNARRYLLPKCGAKSKRTGEPCRQIALANGRCRFHGGRTPTGDAWHKIQFPKRGTVGGLEKLDDKLAKQEKAQATRKRRLRAMSPEERARHEAWQKTHRPGKASDRAYGRQQREAAVWLATVLAERQEQPNSSGIVLSEDVFG